MSKTSSASLPAISAIIVIGAMVTAVPTTAAAVPQGERMYAYCRATEFGSGDGRVWVSSVFAVDSEVYHVGIANSFRSHLEGVNGARVNTPQCAGYHDTRQDALDHRNDALSSYRRFGRRVDLVQWRYQGD
jgi:hypothetical protein